MQETRNTPQEYLRMLAGPDDPLLKAHVFALLESARIDTAIADKVIQCESGYNPKAKHLNSNGTWDIGLWQINDVHGMSVEDRMDPTISTQAAINLIKSPTGWKHWVCFRK